MLPALTVLVILFMALCCVYTDMRCGWIAALCVRGVADHGQPQQQPAEQHVLRLFERLFWVLLAPAGCAVSLHALAQVLSWWIYSRNSMWLFVISSAHTLRCIEVLSGYCCCHYIRAQQGKVVWWCL